jgi:hypothetical protein
LGQNLSPFFALIRSVYFYLACAVEVISKLHCPVRHTRVMHKLRRSILIAINTTQCTALKWIRIKSRNLKACSFSAILVIRLSYDFLLKSIQERCDLAVAKFLYF